MLGAYVEKESLYCPITLHENGSSAPVNVKLQGRRGQVYPGRFDIFVDIKVKFPTSGRASDANYHVYNIFHSSGIFVVSGKVYL